MYNTHNYQSGQVLTAGALNEMDNQIQANEQAVQGINDTLNGINMRTIGIDQRTIDIHNSVQNVYSYLMIDVMNKLNELSNNSGSNTGGSDMPSTGGIEASFQQLGYSMPNALYQAVQEGINLRNNWSDGQSWLNLNAPTFMPEGLNLSNCYGLGNSRYILSWRGYDMPNYGNSRLDLECVMGDVIMGNMGTNPMVIRFGPLTESVTFNSTIYSANDYDGQTHLFNSCSLLHTINGLENVNVSNQRSFSFTFGGTNSLHNIAGLETWDTSNAFTMQGMFESCGVQSLNISTFNTQGVTNMNNMFSNCYNLTELQLPEQFGQIAENVSRLFAYCNQLQSINLSTMNPNANDITGMFDSCTALNTVTLPDGFGGNANSFAGLFSNCWNLQNVYGTIDVGNANPNDWVHSIFTTQNDGMGVSQYNQIRNIVLYNIGKYEDGMNQQIHIVAPYWGADGRDCVIASLVTHSYDRRSNGMSDISIYLNTYNPIEFTPEELNTLSSKGYNIIQNNISMPGDQMPM